ncbi:MAG: hypothetical protein JSR37_05375 [Verrucomicrobia bacterium]|nr:hypothetical protein [Verrucomicrobiota bacterium]MBS0636849.1 hypothetical protein [Verrucomicrobiota bacterium]
MKRFLSHGIIPGIIALLGFLPISGHADNAREKNKTKKCFQESIPAYPWEYISDDNVKTWRFIVMNYYPELFNPQKVESMGKAIEKYISTYFYPSWRIAADIQYYVSPSIDVIVDSGNVNLSALNGPLPQVGTFIPVYLQDEFNSTNIPDNFGTAVHGTVSGSVLNGPDALYYTNNNLFTYGPLPYGTPFIVIPAGGIFTTGNGISAEVAANKTSGDGPTNFYQCLSLTMCGKIIEVLVNPTGAAYIGTGNPLGLDGVDEPTGYPSQIFYSKEAVAPFSQGDCNTFSYKDWTMPNFAFPAYFYPHNTSGVYDFLGRTDAPFKPYKGTQFFLYQQMTNFDISDLEAGMLLSSTSDPCNIQFILNGSIYDFSGWGLKAVSHSRKLSDSNMQKKKYVCRPGLPEGVRERLLPNSEKVSTYGYTSLGKRLSTRVRPNATTFKLYSKKSSNIDVSGFVQKSANKKAKFNPEEPQLFPFQYVDSCGNVVTRFKYINYIPEKLPPDQIDQAIPVLEKHIQQNYLPYWNGKVEIENITIYCDKDLPVFDGTFIPFFLLKASQFNLNKLGGAPLPGGAVNVNNVANVLAGPFLSEYIYNAPELPVGNPYLMVSENNFLAMLGLTSLMPPPSSYSPAAPGTFRIHFDNSVLPLDLRNNNMLLPYVCDLGTSPGVNNLDAPDGIAFLGGGVDALGPYWDFDLAAIQPEPDAGATFVFSVVKVNDATTVSENMFVLPDLAAALLQKGSGDVLATLSFDAISSFTSVIAHEMEELVSDPNYSTYIATSNPPVDGAILFSQLEVSDPVEGQNTLEVAFGKALAMDAFPLPAYFFASMRTNNYDNVGCISRALVPFSRQQIVFQQQGEPLHVGNVFGPGPDFILGDGGSIFDGNTFYPPQNTSVFDLVKNTALSSIYEGLLENKNIALQ